MLNVALLVCFVMCSEYFTARLTDTPPYSTEGERHSLGKKKKKTISALSFCPIYNYSNTLKTTYLHMIFAKERKFAFYRRFLKTSENPLKTRGDIY